MQPGEAGLRSKLAFLLELSTDAVFVMDDQGIIQAANKEAGHILGCEPQALAGESLRTWRTDAPIRPHPDGARPDSLCYSAYFNRRNGEIFLADVSITSATEAGERAYVAIVRDMSWHTEMAHKQNLAAAVFDNSMQAILVTNAANRIIAVNGAFERLTGYAASEVIGQSPRLLQSGRHSPTFYADLWRSVLKSGHWAGEIWDRRKNGEIFPEWLTISVVRDDSGAVTHYVAICHDITERKQSEERLRHVTDFYSALCQVDQLVACRTGPQALFEGICRTTVEYGHLRCASIVAVESFPDNLRVAANFSQDWETGYLAPEATVLALSRAAIAAGEAVVQQDHDRPSFGAEQDTAAAAGSSAGAFPFKRDGRVSGALWVFSDEAHFFDDDLLHLLKRIAEDISFALDGFDQEALRQAAESRANYLARHDILTGLYRRNVIEDAMERFHTQDSQAPSVYSLGLIDLDHFKVINDTYGHTVGDKVLVHTAKILRGSMRLGDLVGRWGGEEFLCLLPAAEPDSALYSMERIRDQLANTPIFVAGRELRVTASIGVASSPSDGKTPAELMTMADAALYRAKQEGGNRVHRAGSTPSIFLVGGQIEEALGRDCVMAAAQPIVSLKDGALVADESLARLVLPNGTTLEARQFIDAAAHLGQLQRIDQAVIALAMRRWAERVKNDRAPILHFVNASAGLLAQAHNLATLLEEARKQSHLADLEGANATPFVIEITERAMLRDRQAVKRHIAPLLEYGFRVALDDFGSGYSSFLYLAEFPVSFLKIEKQLVERVASEQRMAAIVRDIARLGHDLEITTIAEGIEDADTAHALLDLGIDWGQGYHFGRPVLESTTPDLISHGLL